VKDTELENIENMALDDGVNGKIYFIDSINLTEDLHQGKVDISSNVKILHNYMSINSSNMESLNKSAIIYMYNINFNNPIVVKNGIICPNTVCEMLSHINKTIIFRVDSFSYYTIIENPNIVSSGNLGSSSNKNQEIFSINYNTTNKDFFPVNKKYLKLKASQGENFNSSFNINNLYNGTIVVEVSFPESLNDFIKIKNPHVIMEKGEVREFNLDFNIMKDKKPGIYSGAIYLESGGIIKRVDILIEVINDDPLFDILINVDNNIKAGNSISSNIYIHNLGNVNGIYADIYYAIKDFEGNNIVFKQDKVYLEKETNLNKKLSFSKFVPGKRYIFYAEIKYENISAFGYDTFSIQDNKIDATFIIIISFVLFFIVIWLLFKNKRKVHKTKNK